jgi:hypothetical protein
MMMITDLETYAVEGLKGNSLKFILEYYCTHFSIQGELRLWGEDKTFTSISIIEGHDQYICLCNRTIESTSVEE